MYIKNKMKFFKTFLVILVSVLIQQKSYSIIEDKILAKQIFEKMDVDGKGELSLPRYLKIWGDWARED